MRRPGGDDGTVLPLVLGLTGIGLLAVALVVNVSAVVLAKRAIASAADGAACPRRRPWTRRPSTSAD